MHEQTEFRNEGDVIAFIARETGRTPAEIRAARAAHGSRERRADGDVLKATVRDRIAAQDAQRSAGTSGPGRTIIEAMDMLHTVDAQRLSRELGRPINGDAYGRAVRFTRGGI